MTKQNNIYRTMLNKNKFCFVGFFLLFCSTNHLSTHEDQMRKPSPVSCCLPGVSANNNSIAESSSSITDVSSGGTGRNSFDINEVVLGGTTPTGSLQQVTNTVEPLPLVSTGTTTAPEFLGLTVEGGGTGFVTATTAYSLIAAGTTPTGAFQHVDPTSQPGTFVVSNGTSSLPSFKALTPVVTLLSGSGTWSPTANMVMTMVECVGGGGGSGGTSAGAGRTGSGGGAGSYSRKWISAATMAAGTKTYSVGTGGTAGTSGGGTGGTGGTTTFGAGATLCSAPGGSGSSAANTTFVTGGAGGTTGSGDLATMGNDGGGSNPSVSSGPGGNSIFGAGGRGVISGIAAVENGNAYGGGAGGVANAAGSLAGGSGGNGVIIMTEYILS